MECNYTGASIKGDYTGFQETCLSITDSQNQDRETSVGGDIAYCRHVPPTIHPIIYGTNSSKYCWNLLKITHTLLELRKFRPSHRRFDTRMAFSCQWLFLISRKHLGFNSKMNHSYTMNIVIDSLMYWWNWGNFIYNMRERSHTNYQNHKILLL